MRMICPNCGAQYEVDADVIPKTGRDVQCSNCGHTWFQRHADSEQHDQNPPPELDTTPVDEPESVEETVTEPIAETVAEITPEPEQHTPTEDKPEPQRQAMDEGVADILRQESERETAVRNSEAGETETQPLDTGPTANTDAAIAAIVVENNAAIENSRSDLLPDIEEINSTLADTSETHAEAAAVIAPEIQRRSSFRRGFSGALVVFAIMALVYVFSGAIARMVPALQPFLAGYVTWIDGLRTAMDGILLGAVDKITALLSQLNSDG